MMTSPKNPSQVSPPMQEVERLLACYEHGDYEAAEALARSLTQRAPQFQFGWKAHGSILKLMNRVQECIAPMQEAVRLDPHDAEALNNLGDALTCLGDYAQAESACRQATRLAPGYALAHNNLGNALLRLELPSQAEAAYAEAIRLAPNFPQAHFNRGHLYELQGRPAEAEASYREAIRLESGYVEAHTNLGYLLANQGRLAEADVSCRNALRLNPANALAHNNLGLVMLKLDRYAEAEACFREAIRIDPYLHRAHNNLGNALLNLWRLPEAVNAYREAGLLSPPGSESASNSVFVRNYLEALSPHSILEAARQCGESISAGVTQRFSAWVEPDTFSRLRIGFVSGDFKLHPVGYFLEGLMTHFDRGMVETFAYSASQQEDALTKKLRNLFDHWDPIFNLSDQQAATLIHEHGLQILIDLSGHTAHNRLGVFARRPAPLQVTWLGYVGTTGLPEMDWILGSPHSVDHGEEWQFTEKVWRLPETSLCFTPSDIDTPVGSLPAGTSNLITFGCFNNLAKVNDEVIRVWAKVLNAVEKSRLMLKAPQLIDAQVRGRLVKRFEDLGVSRHRLILEGPSSRIDYLAAYQRIDIALDTFPYPGGTTSVEGLWMGVPFVTLRGDRFVARQGEMLARNAGLHDWIAHDSDNYVEVARRHASNLLGLSRLRSELRAQVLRSPLFDAHRFARNFEQAMKSLWQQRKNKILGSASL